MLLKQKDECHGCLRGPLCVCKTYKPKCPCSTCLIKGICVNTCPDKEDLLRKLIGEALEMFGIKEK